MGEPDRSGLVSWVSPRCASASLNDNFVDIGQFHQFAANRIKACPSKRPWFQSFSKLKVLQNLLALPTWWNLGEHVAESALVFATTILGG